MSGSPINNNNNCKIALGMSGSPIYIYDGNEKKRKLLAFYQVECRTILTELLGNLLERKLS